MQGIDFWRFSEELTIVQAALLFTGHDPADHNGIENRTNRPIGYDAIKHAIIVGINTKSLSGHIHRDTSNDYHEEYINLDESTVNVESLKSWLRNKGVRKHMFFFPQDIEEEFLNKTHLRYSPKLAAAVTAWKIHSDKNLLKATTPKKAVMKWLRKNAAEYNLTDDEGRPLESTIEEIAKVVNWDQKGGAPSTPSRASVDTNIKNNETLEINSPTPMSKNKNSGGAEMDDLVPF